jgi:protein-S-isoprenylcysteine O-methyltransferase Ste14
MLEQMLNKDQTRASSAGRVALAYVAWAILHSVLASRQAKAFVERVVGTRRRNGLYRFVYVLQSLVTVGWGTIWFLSLPDRELYHVQPPWSWLMRLGQALSLGMVVGAVRVVGLNRFLGITQFWTLVRGGQPAPEPEAQGPPREQDGALRVAGPFRYTRHPDNLPIFGVVWLFPKMTVNRLTFAVLASAYAVLGSWHEEQRLQAAYGAVYRRYQQAVPFMLPRPWRSD